MASRPGRRHRLTITSIHPEPRATVIGTAATQLGLEPPGPIGLADVVTMIGDLSADHRAELEDLLADPLLQTATWDDAADVADDTSLPIGEPVDDQGAHRVEIALLPGVTDAGATALMGAAERLGIPVESDATSRIVTFYDVVRDGTSSADEIVRRVVANPIIERWGPAPLAPTVTDPGGGPPGAGIVPVRDLSATELERLGTARSLALDPDELATVQTHFRTVGREPTDVELETIAQTWSEHCAHKTFRAALHCDDGVDRPPLLAALRAATDEIAAPFVRSAFVGNAGIVSYRAGTTVALKAETHNHPSAVEPFGGANTGVGGVIRDVLGAAHRPIAVTDVVCFGPADVPLAAVPDGSLHPRRIRAGVVAGIADYGNKIGLPTIAGAVLYDAGFTTNPLVFAGCIGTAPERAPHGPPAPGDRVVVLGGRTGRDGIRGATFSSLTMDATTGAVAGASVQIGDPITEKLLIDALVGAEDLYSAITDCGAGGLSSAVGEMAEGVGADVELSQVPLKYAGLAPWEIWLSEAQERMVVAVPPDRLGALADRCATVGVELTDIGRFTGDGRLVVRHGGEPVLDLDTGFLHDGRPLRHLPAAMPTPARQPTGRSVADPRTTLLRLLAHPNIASKAAVIHRYDHEIGGATLVRPLIGAERDAPADGVLLANPLETHGIAVGIGVNPWYGLHDPEAMAHAVVDEAIRNVVAVGADPDRVSLLDNFSWGDPLRPSTLGELVAAVDGCCAAARSHRAPFVSGKDSLNNEYTGADGHRHAVPPTLVITAVAHHPDVDRRVLPALTSPGNLLLLVGTTAPELAGSHLDLVQGEPAEPGRVPQPDPAAPARYRRLHRAIHEGLVRACHDLSEGGLAVALAEMCIAGRLGAAVAALPHQDPVVALFAESTGRLLIEVSPEDLPGLAELLDEEVVVLGEVHAEPILSIDGLAPLPLAELVAAFAGDPTPDHAKGGDR